MYGDILRYMGHKGDADNRLINIISSCINKLDVVSEPHYVIKLLPCLVLDDSVTLDSFTIKSRALASHLSDCESAFVMTATLGASVDRLIAQRSVINTLEALCLQACADFQIENYCDSIEKKLKNDAKKKDLHITPRFSPGYGDFDIEHQHDILKILDASKKIGVTLTKSYMLSPLKSVTAVIGLKTPCVLCDRRSQKYSVSSVVNNKCESCNKADCEFRAVKGISYD